jgi:hypothetical protein
MRYVIVSLVKGKSQLSYPSYEDALQAARNAWKRDPEGVGMCSVLPLDPSTHHECTVCGMYDETQSHICLDLCPTCNRLDDCGHDRYSQEDLAEMHAVYLDAIAN